MAVHNMLGSHLSSEFLFFLQRKRKEIFVAYRLIYLNIFLYSTKMIANILIEKLDLIFLRIITCIFSDTTYTHRKYICMHMINIHDYMREY